MALPGKLQSSSEEKEGKSIEKETFLTFGTPATGHFMWIASTYDYASQECIHLADLCYRDYPAIIALSDRETMIIGGFLCEEVSSYVEIFDIFSKKCHPAASLSVVRAMHGACSVGDSILVCGGYDGGSVSYTSCELYNRGENRWTSFPEMNEIRAGVATVALPNGQVFCIGGRDADEKALSSVEGCQFPAAADTGMISKVTWKSFAPMHVARFIHNAALFKEKIFVAGGTSELQQYIPTFEIFTLPTSENALGQWCCLKCETKEQMHSPILVVKSNELYAFGNWTCTENIVERLHEGEEQKSGQSCLAGSVFSENTPVEWRSLPPVAALNYVWGVVVVPESHIVDDQ